MKNEIFTAYIFGLIFTIILNIYNLVLSKYLKDKVIFNNWNMIYRVWIFILASIVFRFKFPITSYVVTTIATTLYIFFYLKLILVMNNSFERYKKIVIIFCFIHLCYTLYFSFIDEIFTYKVVVNNSIFVLINIILALNFLNLQTRNRIKNIVVLSLFLMAMTWFARLIMIIVEGNNSLLEDNLVNIISIYSITPVVTLVNISIILFVFNNYHKESQKIKRNNIELHNENVFNRFLNSLLHEINTPLSVALTGITSIEKSETNKDKRCIEEIIENSLNKIVGILNDRKLVYGVDEQHNTDYLTKDLDNILKRVLDNNFTTKNISIVTSFHSPIITISLRKVFTSLLPLLETFQDYGIKNDVLISFRDNFTMEVSIINGMLLKSTSFDSIKIPLKNSYITNFSYSDLELLNKLSYLVSKDKEYIKIIHKENTETFRIIFK